MQAATWNVQGKSLCKAADVLSDQRISFDILALQEVGGLPDGTPEENPVLSTEDFPFNECEELTDYWILATKHLRSHLGQALLLDKTLFPAVLKHVTGTRSIGAKVSLRSGGFVWILGVHFPHHFTHLDEYMDCIQEVKAFTHMTQGTPFLIAGDWNSQPCQPNMDTRALEISCLAAEERLHIAMPCEPTWKDKTYDFFLMSPALHSRLLDQHSAPGQIHGQRELLGCDHQLVTWDIFLRTKPRRRPFTVKRYTGKWLVDANRLADALPTFPPSRPWQSICQIAKHSQYKLPSKKYVDSPALKTLCTLRNRTIDTTLRASLSRQIIRERRDAKQLWAIDIQTSAAAGDPSSIAFLREKAKRKPNWNSLIAACGDKEKAVAEIRTHFTQVFAGTPAEERNRECLAPLARIHANLKDTTPLPIQESELTTTLANLKLRKTSGPTGISNELLLALAQSDDGKALLLQILNNMFVHGDFPEDITGGIVCLIPKVNQAKSGSAARPILLLETLQKVLAKILMDRLKPMWPPLSMQVGAVPGGQAIEALFAAHSMLSIAKVTACNHLFIKLDLKGAFDNIKHSSIASFLASLPPTAAWEADRLLRLILQQRLLFQFLDAEWELDSTRGTPQGGTHSAGLLARTLDFHLGEVTTAWESRGFQAPFHPLWLLLYVDDIMLCYRGWFQACALLPSLLSTLASIGLSINMGKSCVVVNAELLSQAHHCTDATLKQIQWCETTTYLNRPFGYGINVNNICQQIVRRIFFTWGSLKRFLGKCSWTHPHQTDMMLSKYVGATFLWLSPILYPYQSVLNRLHVVQTTLFVEALGLCIPSLRYEEAIQLIQLRRHAAKRWLTARTRGGSWCNQLLRRIWSFTGHVCRQDLVSAKPARILLGHTCTTHSTRLSRPGPWNTLPALLRSFWHNTGFDGDFLQAAQDREGWAHLCQSFVLSNTSILYMLHTRSTSHTAPGKNLRFFCDLTWHGCVQFLLPSPAGPSTLPGLMKLMEYFRGNTLSHLRPVRISTLLVWIPSSTIWPCCIAPSSYNWSCTKAPTTTSSMPTARRRK